MSDASLQSMSDFCWEVISELPHTEEAEQARVWLRKNALEKREAQKVADEIRATMTPSWFGCR